MGTAFSIFGRLCCYPRRRESPATPALPRHSPVTNAYGEDHPYPMGYTHSPLPNHMDKNPQVVADTHGNPSQTQLCIYLAPGGSQSSVPMDTLRQTVGYGTNDQPFLLVANVEEAKLEVAIENDRITFKIADPRVKGFGLTQLPHKATLDTAAYVLGAAARYYEYLGRTNENCPVGINDIAVDFYLLTSKRDYPELDVLLPIHPSLCRKDPSSGSSNVIDFVVDPDARYGIKITNNTPWDLYLNAFLFDNSNLSIAPYHIQSSAGSPKAPLKRYKKFTIGYDTEGTFPLSYSLEESQDVNVGFLKIFFTTWPTDMTDIMQMSPFSRGRTNDDAHRARSNLLPPPRPPNSVHTWFTLDIPVVQRREMYAAV